jgi:hypothetical protein
MDAHVSVAQISAITYILLVIGCIFLAFDFDRAIDMTWTLVLILLTLPWSLISIAFAWALIHGAGLEIFSVLYLAFAGLNLFIVSKLIKVLRRRKNEQNKEVVE